MGKEKDVVLIGFKMNNLSLSTVWLNSILNNRQAGKTKSIDWRVLSLVVDRIKELRTQKSAYRIRVKKTKIDFSIFFILCLTYCMVRGKLVKRLIRRENKLSKKIMCFQKHEDKKRIFKDRQELIFKLIQESEEYEELHIPENLMCPYTKQLIEDLHIKAVIY